MEPDLIRLVEELAANAWRPAIEQHLGGWRLRFSGGDSRRVNSVWPNRALAGIEIEAALDLVEDFYRQHQTIPRYQMCPAALPEDLADLLAQRGYQQTAHTAVMVLPSASLLHPAAPDGAVLEQSGALNEAWFSAYTGASGYLAESLPIRRGILTRIGPPANFVLFKADGVPCATGLGVAERGWLGVFCVVTAPGCRRQGLASAIMGALAQWGQTQGAEQVYLQVMEDNPPALSLYEKLGFKRLYQYFYAEKSR